jgi:hypothetical protein
MSVTLSTEITTVECLRAVYDLPKPGPANKVTDRIDEHAAAFIAKSPFLVLLAPMVAWTSRPRETSPDSSRSRTRRRSWFRIVPATTGSMGCRTSSKRDESG